MIRSLHAVAAARPRGGWLVISLLLVPMGTSFAAAGDPPIVEDFRLVPGSAQSDPQFGTAISISGDTILVGAVYDQPSGGPQTAGTAYVYVRSGDTWVEQAVLSAHDPQEDMDFGKSVAIDGDIAVVGADLDDAQAPASGAAYVFVRNGTSWTEQAKLVALDGSAGDWFGYSVALSGETIAVGVYHDDDLGIDSGSVYVFVRSGSTWSLQTKLLASDGMAHQGLGFSVSIDGDTVVAGVPAYDGGAPGAGAAYVFTRTGTTWSEEARLVASDALPNAQMGRSISVDGDTVVAGAPYHGGDHRGAAYVFQRTGGQWTQTAKLVAPGSETYFGANVAVNGGTVAAGAPRADLGAQDTGVGYVFLRSGSAWNSDGSRLNSDSSFNDLFGSSIALDSDTLAVGAVGANAAYGAAYVFDLASAFSRVFCSGDGSASPCPCSNESTPGSGEGCRNSLGHGAVDLAGGSAEVEPDAMRIHAGGLVPGQPSMLFVGRNAIAGGQGNPFGDGLRCAGGNVVRLGLKAADAGGAAVFGPGLGEAGDWQAGEVRYFQVWYRDPNGSPCGANFNTSNGLELTFQS